MPYSTLLFGLLIIILLAWKKPGSCFQIAEGLYFGFGNNEVYLAAFHYFRLSEGSFLKGKKLYSGLVAQNPRSGVSHAFNHLVGWGMAMEEHVW